MTSDDGRERLDVVTKRADFLTALRDGPLGKQELLDRFEHSRSTVDRAMNELVDAGLVESGDEGYVTTQSGRLAVARYRAFLDDQRAILDASEVLGELPHDASVSQALLEEATVAAEADEDRLLDVLDERIDAATRYRAVLPDVSLAHLERCREWCRDGGLSVSIWTDEETLSWLRERDAEAVERALGTDGVTVETETVPSYGLALLEDGDGGGRVVLVASDAGLVDGLLYTDGPEAVAWADARLAELRSDRAGAAD